MSKDPRPKILQEVSIPFKKDDRLIQKLDLPVEDMDIKKLLWHLDYPFWEKEGTDDWNLTPRAVIENPTKEPSHFSRVINADLNYPLHILFHNNRWLILDGLHRLTKAVIEHHTSIKVKRIPNSTIPLIKIGDW